MILSNSSNFCPQYLLNQIHMIYNQNQSAILMTTNLDVQECLLKAYIDRVFDKYDIDQNGALDEFEMTLFFNDLFHSLGIQINVTVENSLEAIWSIDQDFNGCIDKKQLYDALRAMIRKPPTCLEHLESAIGGGVYPCQPPSYTYSQLNYSFPPNYHSQMPYPPQGYAHQHPYGHEPFANQYPYPPYGYQGMPLNSYMNCPPYFNPHPQFHYPDMRCAGRPN